MQTITINVHIRRLKTRSAAASTLPFPLPEVGAVWSWRPIQTLLTARLVLYLGQWDYTHFIL